MLTKSCTTCKEDKGADQFGPFKSGKYGLYPVCNPCRRIKAKIDYNKERPTYKLYYRAKRRAKVKGLDFTIQESDIKIPDLCPVFGTLMDIPSLDRIDSSKGYTPDNIEVISNRANMLKNNATLEEMKAIVRHLEVIEIGHVN